MARAVEYYNSVLPKAEKRAVEYYNSVLPKAEKREAEAEPAVEYYNSVLPKAEKRREGTITVDESELGCCLLSDARCAKLAADSMITKVKKRELVDESELGCCLLSDPRCTGLLEGQGL